MSYNIDANLLMNAMNFYSNLGYKPCKCPTLVDEDIISHTLPENRKPLHHIDGKFYVGSAEQSFLQKIKEGEMLYDKMMFITPCQRDEDVLDESHLEVFLKVELINLVSPVLMDVESFYKSIGYDISIVKTSCGYDIELNNVEIGSFGSNSYLGVNYFYGTGIAFPRIEYAMEVRDEI